MVIIPSLKIVVKQSKIPKAGRGVFASEDISKDEVIEVCPVLVLPRKDYPIVKTTILREYYFMWGTSTSALCFGFGSFYNHSYEPNATYKKDIENQSISFIALKEISNGEEITVNYNYGNPNDDSKLWIESIKPKD